MKQNYKIYLTALLLIGAISMMTSGAQAASTLAVLVVGLESDAASDAFATGIGYEVTQNGLYELVTAANNTAVKAKLTALRILHAQGGTVDTVGLAAWGKKNGLDFVQLVVESDCSITVGNSAPVNGREQLSQVVSCGTVKYTERPTYRTRFVPNLNLNLGTEFEEMIFVVGGMFEMGCKAGRDDKTVSCSSNELPTHYVRVNNFYMGKHEVTQALWKKVMGDLPSNLKNNSTFLGDNKPVLFICWDDITGSEGFLEKLNAQTGRNYRLPTEAEWEYAARGCSDGVCESLEFSGSNTVEEVAYGNSSGGPTTVGTKRTNALGFYDMSGNVDEWCYDWYSSSYYSSTYTASNPQDNPTGPDSGSSRVCRGGYWGESAKSCRVAYRHSNAPGSSSSKNNGTGFRLVLP